ncbi:hypothetical protein ACG9Z8_06455 [Acinetobacter ursingii]|uniref:hypothetical protein n=1 Tax=Acinetobacter ursingii TaxID=108980 RepID=UPI003AF9AD87
MRDYSIVSPHFWTGSTGKELRKYPEAMIVSMYLLTSPHANMLGLYYIPLLYVAHETGLGIEGASKGLQWAKQCGFCDYDDASEMVWVYEMARFQIGNQLKEADKRCIGVQKEYNSLPNNPFLSGFYDKYHSSFCMVSKRDNSLKNIGGLQGASEGLRSQEQEQDQEQDNTHTLSADENQNGSWKPDSNFLLNVIRESVGIQAQKVLDMPDYEFHLGNFNAHWENKIDLTENQRTRKFAQWLIIEFKKIKSSGQPKSAGKTTPVVNRNVNDAWGEIPEYAPAVDDIDLGDMV